MSERAPEARGAGSMESRGEYGPGAARKDRRWSVVSAWNLSGDTFNVMLPDTHITPEQASLAFARLSIGQGGALHYALVSIDPIHAYEFGSDDEGVELLSFQPLTHNGVRWQIGEDMGPRTVTITTEERA